MTEMSHCKRPAVMIFMRRPEPGRVKTRLAKTTGSEVAYQVYCKLLLRTLGLAAEFHRNHPSVEVFIFVTPAEAAAELDNRFPGPWKWLPQSDGHLGRRMEQAFLTVWRLNHDVAILIGTDIADLTPGDLDAALAELKRNDAVLGPSADGGFYLIGLKPGPHSAFADKQWSTSRVFKRTHDLLRQDGVRVATLSLRHDVDTEKDLHHYNADPFLSSRVSVIIPTLSSIDRLLPAVERLAAMLWPQDEIIVVQGRRRPPQAPVPSTPCRISMQRKWIRCCRVEAERGRGRQLQAGARLARGDILCFVHDDTIPPTHFAYQVRKIMRHPDATLGCFLLAFRPTNRRLQWIARWSNFRTRRLHLPYGDQMLFCRRDCYRRIGGMPPLMLMEDIAFVRKALQAGDLLVIPETVETSPARYLKKGVLRASLQNHLLALLFRLGVADTSLYHLYYRSQAPGPGKTRRQNGSLCQKKHIYKGL